MCLLWAFFWKGVFRPRERPPSHRITGYCQYPRLAVSRESGRRVRTHDWSVMSTAPLTARPLLTAYELRDMVYISWTTNKRSNELRTQRIARCTCNVRLFCIVSVFVWNQKASFFLLAVMHWKPFSVLFEWLSTTERKDSEKASNKQIVAIHL